MLVLYVLAAMRKVASRNIVNINAAVCRGSLLKISCCELMEFVRADEIIHFLWIKKTKISYLDENEFFHP